MVIRLNKVLKELNISIDRAVDFLESVGEKIERTPNYKISLKQYELLKDEFADEDLRHLNKNLFVDYDNTYKYTIDALAKAVTVSLGDVNLKIGENLKTTISKKQSINNLRTAYRNDKLVLVLGAGLSLTFGIPDWNSLLQKLMVHTIEERNKDSNALSRLYNKIFSPNPLISARYLQDYFEKHDSSFEKLVRDVMYQNIDKNSDSPVFDEIVKMCVAPGKSPNINSIVTYNFDDILEHKLQKTNLDIPFKSVYGIGMEIKNEELPIYHVHGFLPEKGRLDESNIITFGESNYHQQYNDVYSWNNMVQINKFRDNTCLFIGTSLSDPNIRRLLDIALKQKGNSKKHHYIIKKRTNKKNLMELITQKNLNEDNEDVLDILLKIHESFEENDSSTFGVKTIWIDEWEQIPEVLKSIREIT